MICGLPPVASAHRTDVQPVIDGRPDEAAWQAASNSFAERLLALYGDFEDIVCPLLHSLYQVKSGLRLQAACVAPTAQRAAGLGFAQGQVRATSSPRVGLFESHVIW